MDYSLARKEESCCYFEDFTLEDISINTLDAFEIPVYDQRVIDKVDYIYCPVNLDIFRDDLSELLSLYEPATLEYSPSIHITPKTKKKPSVWKRILFLFDKNKKKEQKNGTVYM